MGSEINQTRESLLDAAISLFSAKGYAAVGIREIAEVAEANIASIKYHFGSKHDLYLSAVKRVMTHYDHENALGMPDDVPRDPAEAAERLVRFIRLFMFHLIPPGSTVESSSNLMIREALQPGKAIDAVVRESIGPLNDKLISVLTVLLPEATLGELEHHADSVLGQVLHIRVFRPFVERLRNNDLSDPVTLGEYAMHIAEFSLRGIGCEDEFIAEALRAASEDASALVKERKS